MTLLTTFTMLQNKVICYQVFQTTFRGRRGMVVGFTTTFAISANHR